VTTEAEVNDHLSHIAHAGALGLRYHDSGEHFVELALPYDEHLVGDPDTGVIHGGAITALLDNAAGFAGRPPRTTMAEIAIATLDLRIDYMGPATPGRTVIGRATCYHRTRSITFVRAVAYHDSPDDPIATCTATFMTGTPNAPRPLPGLESNGGDGTGDRGAGNRGTGNRGAA
jgi:uncharacterized protein (TIGR00369 family)